jgi:tryptophanase
MVEMMTGLMMACDEEITGRRIAQVGRVASYLKARYNFPIIAGGHALYIAADQVLPSVPLTDCPAETLNALMMSSIKLRGCGLGLLVYGGRVENDDGSIELTNKLTMDSLRLAIPRNQYSDDEMISQLIVIAEAYTSGLFQNVQGGLYPKDYIDNGFYHFGGEYDFRKPDEFSETVRVLKNISAEHQAKEAHS